jgi:putative ABC transport system permease protein
MIRLVFSDLWVHVTVWTGAFLMALTGGYIGGWVVSFMTTADYYTGDIQKSLHDAGTIMFVFSLIAGMAVLVSAANLTIAAQRRSYALWLLANMKPWLVTLVVFFQLAVVAALGAVCGTLLAAATFEVLFPLVLSGKWYVSDVVPRVGISTMPMVWLVVVAVFLFGGLKAARSAGRTPPLSVLREPEPKRMKMTWFRLLLFIVLLACIYGTYYAMANAKAYDALAWALFMPILTVAALAPIAPLTFSMVLKVWTSLVPQKHWNSWFLAQHSACYQLSTSTSVETPIMVGFGLVAGVFSISNVLAGYARSLGVSDTSGFSFDFTTTFVMLGAPILLCIVGTAVSVMMTSRTRTSDVALLDASGARPFTQVMAAVYEAFIHTVTASLVGICGVVITNIIVAYALGLPLFDGLTFGVGAIVSIVGFVLVLAATLIPTLTAVNKDTATILSVQE